MARGLTRQNSNQSHNNTHLLTASPVKFGSSISPSHDGYEAYSPISPEKAWIDAKDSQSLHVPTLGMRPNRRTENGDVEMGGGVPMTLSEENLSKHNERMSKLNHLVYNFTSPIGEISSTLHSLSDHLFSSSQILLLRRMLRRTCLWTSHRIVMADHRFILDSFRLMLLYIYNVLSFISLHFTFISLVQNHFHLGFNV